jgi:hypothetical protein
VPTACLSLFDLATPPCGTAPADTLQAVMNIVHYPWQNVEGLFDLSQIRTLYQPALDSAPDAWTLAMQVHRQRPGVRRSREYSCG